MDNSLLCLYTEIETHDELELIPIRLLSRTAMVRSDGLICIDYSKIQNTIHEKETLMEEISHYEAHAFYPMSATDFLWEKQEYRAKARTFQKYFPAQQIAELMARGYTEVYEIAEQLEISEKLTAEMLHYYTEIKGINFAQLIDEMDFIPPEKQYNHE